MSDHFVFVVHKFNQNRILSVITCHAIKPYEIKKPKSFVENIVRSVILRTDNLHITSLLLFQSEV